MTTDNTSTNTPKPAPETTQPEAPLPPAPALPPAVLEHIRQLELPLGECRLLEPDAPASWGLPYLNPPRPRECSI